MTATEQLGEVAGKIATRAGLDYFKAHGLTYDLDTFSVALKKHCMAKMPVAMADAKEAMECHMEAQAEQTFAATMMLAGIAAAKEVGR